MMKTAEVFRPVVFAIDLLFAHEKYVVVNEAKFGAFFQNARSERERASILFFVFLFG